MLENGDFEQGQAAPYLEPESAAFGEWKAAIIALRPSARIVLVIVAAMPFD